jgi:hypothetical protein
MRQMTIRLESDEERDAFRRAMQDGFRNVQQQARKYIVEGLRREGWLGSEQPSADRSELTEPSRG